MQRIVTAKCAYATGSGNTKGAFHFSLVAEYENSTNDRNLPTKTYRKINIIFIPLNTSLMVRNLNIDKSELMKKSADKYVFNKCPYSSEQLRSYIYPNLRRMAAHWEELKHPVNGKTGTEREDSRFFTDKESGQFFGSELRFIEKKDFDIWQETYKGSIFTLVENGNSTN